MTIYEMCDFLSELIESDEYPENTEAFIEIVQKLEYQESLIATLTGKRLDDCLADDNLPICSVSKGFCYDCKRTTTSFCGEYKDNPDCSLKTEDGSCWESYLDRS